MNCKVLVFLSIFWGVLLSVNSFATDLTFSLKGKVVLGFSTQDVKSGKMKGKYKTVRSSEAKLFNVFRGYERTYQGYDFFDLLNAVYGMEWRKFRKISFLASDGYSQVALIPEMIKSAENKAGFLAFSEKGKDGFTLIDKQGKQIDPGLFYLVWTHFSESDKASHGDTLKWPYQLVMINIE